MCISPLVLKAKPSPSGETTNQVPCGKCFICLSRRQRGWTFRLSEEAKVSSSCSFLTFTYDENNVPLSEHGLPTLDKTHFQKFLKRLRKKSAAYYDAHNIKYYACGEYGTETHRPHYHAIMFNLPPELIQSPAEIEKTWAQGICDVATGNIKTMHYVTKYIMKGKLKPLTIFDDTTGEVLEDDRIQEFSLMSKKMGISFLSKAMKTYLKNNLTGSVQLNGIRQALPRYFKEQAYTKDERLALKLTAEEFRKQFDKDHFKECPILEGEWRNKKIREHLQLIRENRLKL